MPWCKYQVFNVNSADQIDPVSHKDITYVTLVNNIRKWILSLKQTMNPVV